MKRVLVTGCGGPAGVNFIKSLRLAGDYWIAGVDGNRWHLELAHADERYQLKQDGNYVNTLNSIIAKEKIAFLHPQPDSEVRVISEHRDELNVPVFFPSNTTIEILQYKL